MDSEQRQVAAEVAQARILVGGSIEVVLTNPDSRSFGLHVVKNGQHYDVWVDRDPEGNGPGHLNITPG
jgi:hypothetical protein